MAKIRHTLALEDFGNPLIAYSTENIHTIMDESGGKTATFIDDSGGERIVLKGSGFAYLDGDLVLGRVEKVIFQTEGGTPTIVVKGLDISAQKLGDLIVDGTDLSAFLAKIYSGRDQFLGTELQNLMNGGAGKDLLMGFGGDDHLNGQGGNDRMTGGSGADHFYFLINDEPGGKDVITDFDAKGGGGNQDYIGADFEDVVSIKQHGQDVVIDFGGGDTLTLLDVKKAHISEADFNIPF